MCWCGLVTPEPARPLGPRMPGAQHGLTPEYIYLRCGEEVGISVVLHSAMATVAQTDAYGSHDSGATVITAGSAESLPRVGQLGAWRPGQGSGHRRAGGQGHGIPGDARWLWGQTQLWAGQWAPESGQQGCNRRGKPHRRWICWWLQPLQKRSCAPGAWKLS